MNIPVLYSRKNGGRKEDSLNFMHELLARLLSPTKLDPRVLLSRRLMVPNVKTGL